MRDDKGARPRARAMRRNGRADDDGARRRATAFRISVQIRRARKRRTRRRARERTTDARRRAREQTTRDASVRRGARTTTRASGKGDGKDRVYIGKGRYVEDDAKKYAGRDNWFTGGWPGGEKQLKEVFIKEEAAAAEKAAAEKAAAELPEWARGDDTIYVGKGKYVKGDAKQFAGRDNLFTGGWAGGEVGLKVGEQLKMKKGDLVKVAAGGGFLGFGGKPARVGTVRKVNVKKNGDCTIEIAVLPFDRVETVDSALCTPTTLEEM